MKSSILQKKCSSLQNALSALEKCDENVNEMQFVFTSEIDYEEELLASIFKKIENFRNINCLSISYPIKDNDEFVGIVSKMLNASIKNIKFESLNSLVAEKSTFNINTDAIKSLFMSSSSPTLHESITLKSLIMKSANAFLNLLDCLSLYKASSILIHLEPSVPILRCPKFEESAVAAFRALIAKLKTKMLVFENICFLDHKFFEHFCDSFSRNIHLKSLGLSVVGTNLILTDIVRIIKTCPQLNRLTVCPKTGVKTLSNENEIIEEELKPAIEKSQLRIIALKGDLKKYQEIVDETISTRSHSKHHTPGLGLTSPSMLNEQGEQSSSTVTNKIISPALANHNNGSTRNDSNCNILKIQHKMYNKEFDKIREYYNSKSSFSKKIQEAMEYNDNKGLYFSKVSYLPSDFVCLTNISSIEDLMLWRIDNEGYFSVFDRVDKKYNSANRASLGNSNLIFNIVHLFNDNEEGRAELENELMILNNSITMWVSSMNMTHSIKSRRVSCAYILNNSEISTILIKTSKIYKTEVKASIKLCGIVYSTYVGLVDDISDNSLNILYGEDNLIRNFNILVNIINDMKQRFKLQNDKNKGTIDIDDTIFDFLDAFRLKLLEQSLISNSEAPEVNYVARENTISVVAAHINNPHLSSVAQADYGLSSSSSNHTSGITSTLVAATDNKSGSALINMDSFHINHINSIKVIDKTPFCSMVNDNKSLLVIMSWLIRLYYSLDKVKTLLQLPRDFRNNAGPDPMEVLYNYIVDITTLISSDNNGMSNSARMSIDPLTAYNNSVNKITKVIKNIEDKMLSIHSDTFGLFMTRDNVLYETSKYVFSGMQEFIKKYIGMSNKNMETQKSDYSSYKNIKYIIPIYSDLFVYGSSTRSIQKDLRSLLQSQQHGSTSDLNNIIPGSYSSADDKPYKLRYCLLDSLILDKNQGDIDNLILNALKTRYMASRNKVLSCQTTSINSKALFMEKFAVVAFTGVMVPNQLLLLLTKNISLQYMEFMSKYICDQISEIDSANNDDINRKIVFTTSYQYALNRWILNPNIKQSESMTMILAVCLLTVNKTAFGAIGSKFAKKLPDNDIYRLFGLKNKEESSVVLLNDIQCCGIMSEYADEIILSNVKENMYPISVIICRK